MKKPVRDERIIQEAMKQNSLGFTILFFGLLFDILCRQFLFHQPISSYWDLALLFFGTSIYLAVKRISSGIYTGKVSVKRIIPSSIIASIVYSAVNYQYFKNTDLLELFIGAITFFVGFLAVNLLMQYVSQKKNKQILKDE
ncbi:DUF6773 family protein [Tepidanaerobacter syntrophicus]|uniref:DUF6773 family protein n=1 Tax=Tepidanaerobacter syntrophicus TaxID=224999 RepID=UPI001BD49B60|nr:DUF6773 family protein [Tepidanaerobacter syntrophicus]